MPKSQELFTTDPVTVLRHSEKAILFKHEDIKDPFWIPKSQIEEPDLKQLEVGAEEEITIPAWLAKEKDLIG